MLCLGEYSIHAFSPEDLRSHLRGLCAPLESVGHVVIFSYILPTHPMNLRKNGMTTS